MKLTKAESDLLDQVTQGPVTFSVEWLTHPDGWSLAHIVKNHRLYWRANALKTVGLVKVTEVSSVPGRNNVKKWRMTGSTIVKTYRIEL